MHTFISAYIHADIFVCIDTYRCHYGGSPKQIFPPLIIIMGILQYRIPKVPSLKTSSCFIYRNDLTFVVN